LAALADMASVGADRGLAMETVAIAAMVKIVNFIMKVGRSCLFGKCFCGCVEDWEVSSWKSRVVECREERL
jgi:hypothetical protein